MIKEIATLAVSGLVGDNPDTSRLELSLHKILDEAGRIELIKPLQAELAELFSKIEKVIEHNKRYLNNKHNTDRAVEICWDIACVYSNSPDLHITWIQKLLGILKEHKLLEETAHAYTAIAYIILQYLKTTNKLDDIPIDIEQLQKASPNILEKHKFVFTEDMLLKHSGMRLDFWSLGGLSEFLFQGADLMREAKNFEASILLYNLLAQIHISRQDYKSLLYTYNNAKDVTSEVAGEASKYSRSYPKYYRVALFKADGSTESYIYKMSAEAKLGTIMKELKETLKDTSGTNEVVVLTSNDKVELDDLKTSKIYVQIAGVKPFFDNQNLKAYKHHNINKFIFEQAFAGDRRESAAGTVLQQKKKTIFFTEVAFPYFKRRIPVIKSEEIVVTPIQTAIDIIVAKMNDLKAALEEKVPNLKLLNVLLSGLLTSVVSGNGPKDIVENFLTNKEKHTSDKSDRNKLSRAIIELLSLIELALDIFGKAMDDGSAAWHSNAVEKYDQLNSYVRSVVKETSPFLSRKSFTGAGVFSTIAKTIHNAEAVAATL